MGLGVDEGLGVEGWRVGGRLPWVFEVDGLNRVPLLMGSGLRVRVQGCVGALSLTQVNLWLRGARA